MVGKLVFDSLFLFVLFGLQHCSSVSYSKPGHRRVAYGSRRCMGVRASLSSSSDSSGSIASIAPLQLESPVGQFLSQILISHPHLVPAAVEQQLEQLQTDRDAEKQKEEPSATSTDLVLYRLVLWYFCINVVYSSRHWCRKSSLMISFWNY